MASVHERLLGNPTGSHPPAQRARALLEDARDEVAAFLGRDPGEIVFTSGGTEAANLAVLGAAEAAFRTRGEAVVLASAVEHPAVRESAKAAGQMGVDVRELPVDRAGRDRLRRARPDALFALHGGRGDDGQQRDRRHPAAGRRRRFGSPPRTRGVRVHRRRAGGAVSRPRRRHGRRRHGGRERAQVRRDRSAPARWRWAPG